MRKLFAAAAAAAVSVAFGFTSPALANHGDAHPDAAPCDSVTRQTPYHPHGHTGDGDQDLGGVVYIHQHTGHYEVTSGPVYVEVVGGGGYNHPNDPPESQGGFVEAEVDHELVPVDGDLHAGFYDSGRADLCVNVAETPVEVHQPPA